MSIIKSSKVLAYEIMGAKITALSHLKGKDVDLTQNATSTYCWIERLNLST